MELVDLMGTPMTGKGEIAATMPGKCAAPPAPAIITFTPLTWAFFAKEYNFSGVLCAETISTS